MWMAGNVPNSLKVYIEVCLSWNGEEKRQGLWF